MNRFIFSIGKRQKGKPLTLIHAALVGGALEIREWRSNYYMGEKPGWYRIPPSRVVPNFQGDVTEEAVFRVLATPALALEKKKESEIAVPQEKTTVETAVEGVVETALEFDLENMNIENGEIDLGNTDFQE